jgi:hypothetical protein
MSATMRPLSNLAVDAEARLVADPTYVRQVFDALQRMCEHNTRQYQSLDAATCAATTPSGTTPASEPLTYFHSRRVPAMALADLALVLQRHVTCSSHALLAGAVLFCRYCDRVQQAPTLHMMHRLYVACLQLALKAHSDRFPSNRSYARIAGISLQEMNRLETTLVGGLDWNVQVFAPQITFMVQALTRAALPSAPKLCECDDAMASPALSCSSSPRRTCVTPDSSSLPSLAASPASSTPSALGV